MYRCSNCGRTFDFPDVVEDFTSEFWGATVRHTTTVCPSCGSDDYDEMDKCEICGEDIDQGEEICEYCRELVDDLAYDIRNKVREKTIVHKLKYDEFMEHLTERL